MRFEKDNWFSFRSLNEGEYPWKPFSLNVGRANNKKQLTKYYISALDGKLLIDMIHS